ncbi:MAG: sialate O-acetylesterase [Chitinophagales bacterium]
MKTKSFYNFVFLILFSLPLFGDITLPQLVSDGMVLQRNAKVSIWGWADVGEKITLTWDKSEHTTTANESGEWEVILSDLQAGGPYDIKIEGSNTLIVKNILVGDVWVCSGQSNMEISMERARPLYEKEIAEADNPNIHYFEVPKTYDFKTPHKDLNGGKWIEVNRKNIVKFSAVAYFFAEHLYHEYNVPIGLINTSLGGSPAQAWISEDAIKAFPHHWEEVQKFKSDELIKEIQDQDNKNWSDWHTQLRQSDKGYQNPDLPWYANEVNTENWSNMEVPGYWKDTELGSKNGVVWFRKDFEVPKSMLGKTAQLTLGRIVDADSVYVNGVFVGTTGYQYPPRRYQIPADILKEGINTMTVRIINESGNGGFVLDKEYKIRIEDQAVDLKGEWNYRLGAEMPPKAPQTFIRWKPVGLYNAMLHPLLKYRIKGVIWYQGESNTSQPSEYKDLLTTLIHDWRENWQQGNFPFLLVQLTNFMEAKDQPSESNWAVLRNAQLQTLEIPNTAMAVTIDIGEWNDIHPLNKKDVGKRLALAAQKVAYGNKKVVYSGPSYHSMKIKKNKVILSFDHVGNGLMAKGGNGLKEFAIAGEDGKFVWAKAMIKKDKVIVSSEEVTHPIAVRYAWADNPQYANFYNKNGLPASPFTTEK